MKSQCDNCGWKGEPKIELEEIPVLHERLDPGSIVPSGECPKCGALCYLVEPKPKKIFHAVQITGAGGRGPGTGWEVRFKKDCTWLTVCDCWCIDGYTADVVSKEIADLLNKHNPF